MHSAGRRGGAERQNGGGSSALAHWQQMAGGAPSSRHSLSKWRLQTSSQQPASLPACLQLAAPPRPSLIVACTYLSDRPGVLPDCVQAPDALLQLPGAPCRQAPSCLPSLITQVSQSTSSLRQPAAKQPASLPQRTRQTTCPPSKPSLSGPIREIGSRLLLPFVCPAAICLAIFTVCQ